MVTSTGVANVVVPAGGRTVRASGRTPRTTIPGGKGGSRAGRASKQLDVVDWVREHDVRGVLGQGNAKSRPVTKLATLPGRSNSKAV